MGSCGVVCHDAIALRTGRRTACRGVDTHAFADALVSRGYARLTIQKGAGEYSPCVLVPPGSTSALLENGLEVE
jgi:hypothetical protein